MSWAVGFDSRWNRDIGYGVPAKCDHPGCDEDINRGIGWVCGAEVYGGEHGCGLFFCGSHRICGDLAIVCERCNAGEAPFEPTPDVPEWTHHKETDPSWAEWRAERDGKEAQS